MREKQVERLTRFSGELSFTVDRYDDADTVLEDTIARASNLLVARAAYEEAVKLYPHANLCLRHGIREIERSRGK